MATAKNPARSLIIRNQINVQQIPLFSGSPINRHRIMTTNTSHDTKRTLSGFRKRRHKMTEFLFGEVVHRRFVAYRVGAMFTLEEVRTLLSVFPFVDLDAHLYRDGEDDGLLINGTVGDPDDPPVFATFAGRLALFLLDQAYVCQLESTYFPASQDANDYIAVLYRKLAALSPEESLVLMVILAAEQMMIPGGVRSDNGQGLGVIPLPSETRSTGNWYALALIESTFPPGTIGHLRLVGQPTTT